MGHRVQVGKWEQSKIRNIEFDSDVTISTKGRVAGVTKMGNRIRDVRLMLHNSHGHLEPEMKTDLKVVSDSKTN